MQSLKKILILVIVLLITMTIAAVSAEEAPLPTPEPIIMGEGEKCFAFQVVDMEGALTNYLIYTDAEYVGKALYELEIVDGDFDVFGLYIKTVQGIRLDYNECGHYWAFYIDNEMAMTGVDSTPISEESIYSLRAE